MSRLRGIFFVLVAVILLCGCDRRPANVLSQKRMAKVLFDIHRTEAVLSTAKTSTNTVERQAYFDDVFKKHKTSKEQFDRSLEWYVAHPKKYVAIYDTVQVWTEKFADDVIEYRYQERNMKFTSNIDSIDIWLSRRSRMAKLQEYTVLEDKPNRGSKPKKVVKKELRIVDFVDQQTDTCFFGKGDTYRFRAKIRAYAPDSVHFTSRMIFTYKDSKSDTIFYSAPADSLARNYKFTYTTRDDISLKTIRVEMIDSARTITNISAENITFYRIYDRTKTKIEPRMRDVISRRQHPYEFMP